MQAIIKPSFLHGSIPAPTSKSSMQRACAAALLAKGVTTILNPGNSNDDRAALGVIQALGAKVEVMNDGSLRVQSQGVHPEGNRINCGESGLGIRMFAPLAALSNKQIVINGEGSLLTRPMDFFDSVFPQLGVEIISSQGRLPLTIRGPLQPKNITIDGSLSSQFLTGLLMAYAASGATDVSITVIGLTSKPYIDLTLQVMEKFDWKVENRNYETFYFSGNNAVKQENTYTVEGDWSGAAFLLVAGVIAGPVTITGLDINSTQADRAILLALENCGAGLVTGSTEIRTGPGNLRAFRFDATECPDLFPPLVALAAYCPGDSEFTGAGRLTHKESNRALTLKDEFGKMGIDITLQEDTMIVHGGKALHAAVTHSRHDHRIAMAAAVAALRADGEVCIEESQAVNKSYPDFYTDLQKLGASVLILNGKVQTG